MDYAQTIPELLQAGAAEATALSEPGGVPLSYGALRELVAGTVAELNARGIGSNDRVAIMLDNGPAMAAAFLGIAAGATAAPLNPAYRAEEFEFYLTDLRARLLVVGKGKYSPAIEVASRLGVAIARLSVSAEQGAGSFVLEFPGERVAQLAEPQFAGADDIALVMHTSGTTSRPKIVPLSQCNVCTSARNVRESLALNGRDHGLCIMPLFYISGLIDS